MRGHIEITDKVKFVYHELPKPDKKNFTDRHIDKDWDFDDYAYKRALKAYEASKKTVEIENRTQPMYFTGKLNEDRWIFGLKTPKRGYEPAKDNQKCEAEITNNKATIIKIN